MQDVAAIRIPDGDVRGADDGMGLRVYRRRDDIGGTAVMAEDVHVSTGASPRALSSREREVLDLLGDGLAVSDIADRLHLSIKTIEGVFVRLRGKVGCSDAATLRRFAVIRRRQDMTAHLLSRSVPLLHHAKLDHEHNEMLRLISRIEQAPDDLPGMRVLVDKLSACTRFHIDGEQALMRASGFPHIIPHCADHQRILAEIDGFRSNLGQGNNTLAAFQTFVAHWMGSHVDTFDRPLVAFLAQTGAAAEATASQPDGGTWDGPSIPDGVVTPAFLDRTIQGHLRWKIRLYTVIANQEVDVLDRTQLCADGHCDLGRWIHGDGRGLAAIHAYQALQEAHRRFHVSVGRIYDLASTGHAQEAMMELHAGDFYQWSCEVVRQIIVIRNALADGRS